MWHLDSLRLSDTAVPPGAADPSDGAIAFGPFRLHAARQLLLEFDRPVPLGARALDILIALSERPGELVGKEELFARVWPDVRVDESNLRAQVAALRRALGDGRDGARYVATVPGRGYRFVAPVRRLHESPAVGDTALRSRKLAARLSRLVGRDEIVRAIGARLQRRRFLTVVGPGGIGKTTVALAVADSLAGAYADGVCFVDLASLSDPRLVASALASALGGGVAAADASAAVVERLRETRMLIVLDSCEHVVEEAAVLAERLLRAAPDVHVLATSREPLRADGESVQRLAPLEVPPPTPELTAAEALTFSAIELFVERASACADGFELRDEDAPRVAEICRRLDGIALAIELVAGRVSAFGVAGIAAHLDDRFRLLTQGRRTALPRHQTLSAALDWSYEFLPEPERVILRRLSVFAGGFTLDSASAVACDDDLGSCELLDGVASLVSKSLVAVELGGAVGIYRLLDTTRAYARAKLAKSGEREGVARRHAEHYRDLMQAAAAEWEKGRPLGEWLACHARQIDNVRAALDWAFGESGDPHTGVELTVAAIALWFQLPLIDECFGRVQQALDRVDPGPRRDAHARHAMALLAALGLSRALASGFAPEAIDAFARALEIAEKTGDSENQLGMLYGLWTCRYATGEYRAALELGRRFADLADSAPEPADRSIGDRLVGIPLHHLGEHAQARERLERMLASYVAPPGRSPTIRYQSDQRVLARATLSRILWLQGLPERARDAALQTVADARATGHAISIYSALANAACPIALLLGDLAWAEESVASLREHAARHGLGPWVAMSRCFEGALRVARGEIADGLPALRAGLAEISRSHSMRVEPLLLTALAEAQAASGDASAAHATLDDAIARCERQEERWCEPELLRVNAMLVRPEDASRAESILLASLDEARAQGALAFELRSATTLAAWLGGNGHGPDARERLASVYARFVEGFASADLVAAKARLEAAND